jgi:hypothetical protein
VSETDLAALLRIQGLENVALRAEIERLRAALRMVLAIAERNETGPWADRARAALSGKGET